MCSADRQALPRLLADADKKKTEAQIAGRD
jgi:hypothetical protein